MGIIYLIRYEAREEDIKIIRECFCLLLIGIIILIPISNKQKGEVQVEKEGTEETQEDTEYPSRDNDYIALIPVGVTQNESKSVDTTQYLLTTREVKEKEKEEKIKKSITSYQYLNKENLLEILTNYDLTMEAFNEAKCYTEKDIKKVSRTIYGEARSNKIPEEEKAAVAWCITNRIDNKKFGNSFNKVLTVGQFHGLRSKNWKTFYHLAEDVLIRWTLEKLGIEEVGRILPLKYVYFHGKKGHNHFKTQSKGKKYWDWSLESPY